MSGEGAPKEGPIRAQEGEAPKEGQIGAQEGGVQKGLSKDPIKGDLRKPKEGPRWSPKGRVYPGGLPNPAEIKIFNSDI